MPTVTVIIVVLVVVLALAIAAYAIYRKQRSAQLQQRFGSEYDRAVEGSENRRQAEAHLAGVAHRRDQLDVRDLDESERERFTAEWDVVQARFVDEPGRAVDQAEALISRVMRDRGYPVDDFDQRADLVAADHPEVVQHYREAHAAHERHRSSGGLDTEDLRQSFVHYRALFGALVHPGSTGPADADRGREDDGTNRSDGTDEPVDSDRGPDTDIDADTSPHAGPGPRTGGAPDTDPDGPELRSTYPQETR